MTVNHLRTGSIHSQAFYISGFDARLNLVVNELFTTKDEMQKRAIYLAEVHGCKIR